MTNEECLEKALEYTGITNNCCNKVDKCIFTNQCYCFGEISECEEYTVFKRIKSALEREPVRHARWLKDPHLQVDFPSRFYMMWKCSECSHSVDNPTPYCPYCGAKMDAEEDEE